MPESKKSQQNQTRPVLLFITLTVVILALVIAGVYFLTRSQGEEQFNNTNSEPNNETVRERAPVTTELIIVHKDKSVDVELFSLTIQMLEHELGENDSVTTEMLVSDLNSNNELGKISFAALDEIATVPGYDIQLVSTTELAAQIVVSLQEQSE